MATKKPRDAFVVRRYELSHEVRFISHPAVNSARELHSHMKLTALKLTVPGATNSNEKRYRDVLTTLEFGQGQIYGTPVPEDFDSMIPNFLASVRETFRLAKDPRSNVVITEGVLLEEELPEFEALLYGELAHIRTQAALVTRRSLELEEFFEELLWLHNTGNSSPLGLTSKKLSYFDSVIPSKLLIPLIELRDAMFLEPALETYENFMKALKATAEVSEVEGCEDFLKRIGAYEEDLQFMEFWESHTKAKAR